MNGLDIEYVDMLTGTSIRLLIWTSFSGQFVNYPATSITLLRVYKNLVEHPSNNIPIILCLSC